MIHIPAEVTEFVTSPRAFKLVVIIYRNDRLYQPLTAPSGQSVFVPSSVMSANISKFLLYASLDISKWFVFSTPILLLQELHGEYLLSAVHVLAAIVNYRIYCF